MDIPIKRKSFFAIKNIYFFKTFKTFILIISKINFNPTKLITGLVAKPKPGLVS